MKKDKWDKRFMDVAKLVSSWSEDTDTQVGCVVVNKKQQIVTTGYNGLSRGIKHLNKRLARPEKYKWIEHAERNAIYQAANIGVSLKNTILYTTLFPCTDCARAIVQSGISCVVSYHYKLDNRYSTWGDSWNTSKEILTEAGVTLVLSYR